MIFQRSAFLKAWKDNLRDAQLVRSKVGDSWEGKKAVDTLRRRGLLKIAQFEPDDEVGFKGLDDWRAVMALEDFEGLANAYESLAQAMPAPHERSKLSLLEQGVLTLTKLDRAFQTQDDEPSRIKPLLRGLRRCKVDLENALAFNRLGPWKHYFREELPLPRRGSDLDSWFQKGIGYIIQAFLQTAAEETALSQQTISRLVLLFYISAGFVRNPKPPLRAFLTPTEITLHGVAQNLSRVNLKKNV
jgi:hypothetical protein